MEVVRALRVVSVAPKYVVALDEHGLPEVAAQSDDLATAAGGRCGASDVSGGGV